MKAKNKRVLTELFVRKVKVTGHAINFWDAKCPNLCLRVQPNTHHRAFKFVYSIGGRARWLHLRTLYLADARRLAFKLQAAIAEGRDPVAERRMDILQRNIHFADLHQRYVKEHSQRNNKSWKQADRLVRSHLLPRWGKLDAASITRADVRAMMGRIKAPIVANQTLAAASAVFTWAMKQEIVIANPCTGVDANPTTSRERILSDTEIRAMWPLFNNPLRVILLTGQRPGEVSHMRREHVKDGWWELPGQPCEGWPGTKDGRANRIWLSDAVQEIIATMGSSSSQRVGFVFGKAVKFDRVMRDICQQIGCERATPHDLRRTFGSTITRLGFGRQAMDRILNHADHSVGSVYDRYPYEGEDKRIMETVARHVVATVEGRGGDTVVLPFGKLEKSS